MHRGAGTVISFAAQSFDTSIRLAFNWIRIGLREIICDCYWHFPVDQIFFTVIICAAQSCNNPKLFWQTLSGMLPYRKFCQVASSFKLAKSQLESPCFQDVINQGAKPGRCVQGLAMRWITWRI
jgi:hypothetical protein